MCLVSLCRFHKQKRIIVMTGGFTVNILHLISEVHTTKSGRQAGRQAGKREVGAGRIGHRMIIVQ